MEQFFEDIDGAVTICDTEGNVVYMNKRSRETFNKQGQSMVGQNLMPCHKPRSQAIIRDMLENDHSHCYTITKHGQRKLIFQTPWREEGQVRGLVEFSFVLPDEIEHIAANNLLFQPLVTLTFCIVDGIPIAVHLVNSILWRHVFTLYASVIQTVFSIEQIGIDDILLALFREPQHDVWSLYRSEGTSIVDSRFYSCILLN